MSRRLLLAIGTPVAAVLIAAAVVAAVWRPWEGAPSAGDGGEDSGPQTVAAERTTLTSDLLLTGALSFGDEVSLPGRPGTITALPAVGTEIAIGQSLYEVDGRPVIAVGGDRPFWRELALGMDDGADVRQLEQALADLGFGADVTIDDEFTWATAAAVEAWQEALGLAETGVVQLGDIVAINAGSVRISTITARLGDQAGAGPLTYTSTRLRVVADLTEAQSREIAAGTAVTVRLPDGGEVPATIGEVDPGGEPDGEGGTTSASAVVDADDPAAFDGVGLRSVKVVIARSAVADALVVPVTALIATLDGGYAVDVLRDDGEIARLAVELGLIADTRVQVTGGELVEGDLVVVAR
jgi:hypothetical protein